MGSIYLRPEVKQAIDTIYADKLSRWPVPYEEITIKTRYGSTHLVASGPQDGFPLLLLPGLAVTAMMWLPNVAALSKEFRCFAVDVIGDFGRSELANPRKAIRTGQGYSRWLIDVLDGLGAKQAHLLGASNGGYAALNLAADAPQRVARLALLAPSGLTITLREILPKIFHYLLFPNELNRERLIDWFIGNDPVVREDFYEQIWWGLQGLPKVAIPILFPAARLKQIASPALFIFGEHDPAVPAENARRRVEKYLPHAQTLTLPEISHVVNYQAAREVEQAIIKFLKQ